MDETGQEVRPSSGDSESGSEGFVQVTQEDARLESERTEEQQLGEETRIPAVDDDMDLCGGPDDGEGEEEEQEGEQAHKEEEMEEEAEPDVVRRPRPMCAACPHGSLRFPKPKGRFCRRLTDPALAGV